MIRTQKGYRKDTQGVFLTRVSEVRAKLTEHQHPNKQRGEEGGAGGDGVGTNFLGALVP